MATGEIKWFSGALLELGKGTHDLSADTIKWMLLTSSTTPAITDTDPRYGSGGSVNFTTNECSAGGNYSTGGTALASVTWTNVSGIPTLRATDVTMTAHASNPTDARWVVFYNNTATNKNALFFVDLGAVKTFVSLDLVIDFQGAGTDIVTLTQS